MTERSRDRGFMVEKRSFYIYCTVCDTLVFIHENTIEYASNHLKKCITEKYLAYSKPVWKNEGVPSRKSVSLLSSDEIEKIYQTYWVMYSKGLAHYSYDYSYEGRKRIVNRLINNAKVIQQAWRAFQLRPETWAKRVWNMVGNDGTPNEKKFLGITPRDIRIPDDRYVWYIDRKILAKDVPAYHQNGLYDHYTPYKWAEKKKDQLRERLGLVSYIFAFIVLHLQGYRIVEYSGWTYMLKWLSNPEYYCIDESGNERIIRSLEYSRYMCKTHGKPYPCESPKINYFETKYIYILGKEINIDFSDSNNNCEYVR
ncbi:20690_t:CDS:1 [Dentiscutata erythropus]|uniref:20690_t:CDS:1 n=1 Tax=Dentiscutata erythropus TaxID=1348616 RepID=A0A9N9J8T3_9GLOM|nr:20690_t:CDS:1 [Dentiscutata erythropus]